MAEKVSIEQLKKIMDDFNNAKTVEEYNQGYEQANQILQNFVSGELEVDTDTLATFCDFLNLFSAIRDENGNVQISELGRQALDKYNTLVDGMTVTQTYQNRIYSLNSDKNQMAFDVVSFGVFQSMGLIDKNKRVTDLSPAKIAQEIDSIQMSEKQQIEYAALFVDTIIADTQLFESVPPKILANAYTDARRKLLDAKDAKTRQQYQNRFETLARRIDFLIENFSTQVYYWYIDPANLMDVREGYEAMFNVRQRDLKEKPNQNTKTKAHNKKINDMIESGRKRLTDAIKEYEELYHLTKLNPENAEELKERWIDLKQRLSEIDLDSEETLAVIAKYQFMNKDGEPMPQFLDEKGNPSLEYKPGYKVNPDGRLAQIINLSRNNVTMQNVADLDTPVQNMDLKTMLDEEIPWTVSEISIPDEVINGIAQAPDRMTDKAAVEKLWDSIKENGGSISDPGYQAALDAHVNHAVGFAECLGHKIGHDKDVVFMPVEAVEEIDKLADARTEGGKGRKQKIGLFKRIAKNFGMGAAVSAGLTFLGKATGVASIGAIVGTTIGVGNMIHQGLKWRREQQKAGKPHGLKAFISDKRNWAPAVTTGLGIAATISMATGNPELAMGFGLGAMAVGTGTSVVTTYNAAINAGYSRGGALAGAIGVGASGILGALAGRAAMNGLVNYVNNNTDSTLFKHTETTETTRTEIERHYKDGVIANNERILNMWEDPATLDARLDGLMNAGLSRDDAVRYLLAFHDATDHNLGPEYFRSIGMPADQLAALRNSISGTEINLTPESLAAFDRFNPHISAINQVGYVEGAPTLNNLPANATVGSNGEFVTGKDFYTTYANHDSPFQNVPVTITDVQEVLVANELDFPAGLGTFGIYEPKVEKERKLRGRTGSFADTIEDKKDVFDPHHPRPNPNPKPKPEPGPGPKPPKQEFDLTVKLKSSPEAVRRTESLEVSGKMKEGLQYTKEETEEGVLFKAVVPYDISTPQPKGAFKIAGKSFTQGPIESATVTSYAEKDGIHIEIMYKGVDFSQKGNFRLDFNYTSEVHWYEETVKKGSRIKRSPTTQKKTKGFQDAISFVKEGLENAKGTSNEATWQKAKQDIEALIERQDITEQKKQDLIAQIVAQTKQTVS